MNKRVVIHVVSAIVIVIGCMLLLSAGVGFLMHDSREDLIYMCLSACVSIVIGCIAFVASKTKKSGYQLGVREGFGIVTLGWIAASVFGCTPYITIMHMYWYDAFFETMSGFTTTGASVLDNSLVLMTGNTLSYGIADLPKSLMFWRSMTHWLGGMGIVVLSLAILPFLGIGAHQLYSAEAPGFKSDQLTPRIAQSAKILWGVYVLLTLAETFLLWIGSMPLFDAFCTAFGTMATGGFSTEQASIGAYNSVYFDIVICVFMFLAGCNFILHYKALRGKPLFHWKDEEFRFYFAIVILSISVITLFFMVDSAFAITTTTGIRVPTDFFTSLRYSSFQVLSMITTTGFATADFNLWPPFVTVLLVSLMFIGGCGGSTGGGMKVSRVLLVLKYIKMQLDRCLFPHLLSNVRLNDLRILPATIHKVLTFFILFILIFLGVALVLFTLDGNMDARTSLSASIAALGNIGPGLGNVGATRTYSWVTPPAKCVLCFAMLLGRLELYTVLVLFLPTFWKK